MEITMDLLIHFAIGHDHMYERPVNGHRRYRVADLQICHHCGKVFSTEKDLTMHKWMHRPSDIVKVYECFYCDRNFSTTHFRKDHEKTHVPRFDSIECFECGISFSTPLAFLNHEEEKTCWKENFGCCDIFFTRRMDFLRHQQDFHDAQEIECHACFVCGKNFSLHCTLTAHQKCHKELTENLRFMPEEFTCMICWEPFVDKAQMIIHGLTHIGEETFVCEKCGKCYTNKSDYALHGTANICVPSVPPNILVNLWDCDYCEMSFRNRFTCLAHQRLHTEKKPFRCIYCMLRFSHQMALTRHHVSTHMGTNTGTKRRKTLAHRSTLRTHIETHSEDLLNKSKKKLSSPGTRRDFRDNTLGQGQSVKKRVRKRGAFQNPPTCRKKRFNFRYDALGPGQCVKKRRRKKRGSFQNPPTWPKKTLKRDDPLEYKVLWAIHDQACPEVTETSDAEKFTYQSEYKASQDYGNSYTFPIKLEAIENKECESLIESVATENVGYRLPVPVCVITSLQAYNDKPALDHCKGSTGTCTESVNSTGNTSIKSENNYHLLVCDGDKTALGHRKGECTESFQRNTFHAKTEVIDNEDCVVKSINSENDSYCTQISDSRTGDHTADCKMVVEDVTVESNVLAVYDYNVEVENSEGCEIEKQKINFVEADLTRENTSIALTPNV